MPLTPGTEEGKYSDWKEDQQQRDPHSFHYQDYFSITNAAGRDFLVAPHSVKSGAPIPAVRDVDAPDRPKLEINNGGRTDRVELRLDRAEVRLGQDAPLRLGLKF